jgi:hypothetical protein
VAALWLVVTLLFVAGTVALFRRAYPLVDVDLALDRAGAIRAARALAAADRLAPPTARAAATFARDDSLATYVDLAAGGADSVRALARGGPVPLYAWAVRLYTPGEADEVTVHLTPAGRPAGVERRLPETAARPTVDEAAGGARPRRRSRASRRGPAGRGGRGATSRARTSRSRAAGASTARTASSASRPAGPRCGSARRPCARRSRSRATAPGRRGGGARVRAYADVPEAWARRYGEMRSANELLALLSNPPLLSSGWAPSRRSCTGSGAGWCAGARRRWSAAPSAC